MRAIASTLAVFAVAVFVGSASAEDKKEVTLKGKVTSNNCDLKKSDSCQTVLVVKKGEKETVYVFDKAGHKKYHAGICKGGKPGTVTGTVSKDGDMMINTVKSLKFE
jgi:hypothetical protein